MIGGIYLLSLSIIVCSVIRSILAVEHVVSQAAPHIASTASLPTTSPSQTPSSTTSSTTRARISPLSLLASKVKSAKSEPSTSEPTIGAASGITARGSFTRAHASRTEATPPPPPVSQIPHTRSAPTSSVTHNESGPPPPVTHAESAPPSPTIEKGPFSPTPSALRPTPEKSARTEASKARPGNAYIKRTEEQKAEEGQHLHQELVDFTKKPKKNSRQSSTASSPGPAVPPSSLLQTQRLETGTDRTVKEGKQPTVTQQSSVSTPPPPLRLTTDLPHPSPQPATNSPSPSRIPLPESPTRVTVPASEKPSNRVRFTGMDQDLAIGPRPARRIAETGEGDPTAGQERGANSKSRGDRYAPRDQKTRDTDMERAREKGRNAGIELGREQKRERLAAKADAEQRALKRQAEAAVAKRREDLGKSVWGRSRLVLENYGVLSAPSMEVKPKPKPQVHGGSRDRPVGSANQDNYDSPPEE